MKIAISANGATLDAEVDPRFGRCQQFIIADTETNEFEAVVNSNAAASGGAGISTAQMIADKGVEAVLTGNCGPNAYRVLDAAGVKVITGVSGKISDVVEEFKLGTYSASQQANVQDHYGMGGGAMGGSQSMGGGMGMGGGRGGGMGMGGGRGGGMGMGGGRGGGMGMGDGRGGGMGRGMGAGMMPPVGPAPQPVSPEQEMELLKAQSQAMAEQLAEIQRRIEELSKKQK